MKREYPGKNKSADSLPKISVVIATFNRAHLVLRAVQSVLQQSLAPTEIIIVDDCSTDNTREVIEDINDPRIKYILHCKNRGGGAARNTGIKAATGIYIAFLDSDDEWFLEKLEKQMTVFAKSNGKLGAVGAGRIIHYVDTGREEIKIPKDVSGNIHKKLLKGKAFPGGTSSIVVKRECFGSNGLFDESLSSSQELDLYLRLSRKYHFKAVREPLVKCFVHEIHSISADEDAQIEGAREILDRYSEEMPTLSLLKAHFHHRIGIWLCRNHRAGEGRKHLLMAVLACPQSMKYLFNFFLSLPPNYHYLLFDRKWLRRKPPSLA